MESLRIPQFWLFSTPLIFILIWATFKCLCHQQIGAHTVIVMNNFISYFSNFHYHSDRTSIIVAKSVALIAQIRNSSALNNLVFNVFECKLIIAVRREEWNFKAALIAR